VNYYQAISIYHKLPIKAEVSLAPDSRLLQWW